VGYFRPLLRSGIFAGIFGQIGQKQGFLKILGVPERFRRTSERFRQTSGKLRQLSEQFRRVPEWFGQTAEEFRRVPE
jgi:hypothetical protein